MNTELTDKVCLITGASRTLGATIARQMAQHGAHVVINYHQSQAVALHLCDELGELGVRALPVQADVSQPDQAARLIADTLSHFGALDILVNNVGPYVDTPLLELPLSEFERIWAGNVQATFMLTQAAGRAMKQAGHGVIVNIAATDAFHRSHSVYGLAKQGVIHLTEAFALELAPEVRIHALAPDLIADNEEMSAEFTQAAIDATPMARLVTRAEVAALVCLLCTAPFAMINGQTIVMDGGRSIPRIALGKQPVAVP
jgi:NAD(P)-dependent dehydrogenase (short-subunit alcohol dehydrogenase family)